MSELTLKTQKREHLGTSATRRYRRAGFAPVVVYGANKPNESMLASHNQLSRLLEREASHSAVIQLDCAGKSQDVILRAVQRHPYKPVILHVDFQRVQQRTELHITVPIHIIGADQAPGIKVSGGIVSQLLTEIDISCLPKDLPEFIEIDISQLDRNESLHVSDMALPQGVKLTDQSDTAAAQTVVSILMPSSEKQEPSAEESDEELES